MVAIGRLFAGDVTTPFAYLPHKLRQILDKRSAVNDDSRLKTVSGDQSHGGKIRENLVG